MTRPLIPENEIERLRALQSTHLLDTPSEERFDRITRLAAGFFNVKICLLSLVDEDRQWFKSKLGLEVSETHRDVSFCAHTILDHETFVVCDATADPRFASNPLVTGKPHIRFYAGAPICERNGFPIGTLCIIDPNPRTFSEDDKRKLRDFADIIEYEIARISEIELQQQLIQSSSRVSTILDSIPDMVLVINKDLCFVECKEHSDLLIERRNIIGKYATDVLPPFMADQLSQHVSNALKFSDVIFHDYTLPGTNQSFEARYKKINDNEVLIIIRNTTEEERFKKQLEMLSEVAKQTTNGVVITDKDGLTLWINEAFTDITGYLLDEVIGEKPGQILQGEDTRTDTIKAMHDALNNDTGFDVEVLNYTKRGAPYWVRLICNPLRNQLNELAGYIAVQVDITQQKKDAELIQYNQKLVKAVIDTNKIGTWHLNLQTGELLINDKWAELLGYTLDELEPIDRSTWERLTHPEDLAFCTHQLKKHSSGEAQAYEANIRMRHKDGRWVWIHTQGRISSFTADGKVEWMLGTHFDIDAQITAEKILNEQSIKTQAIVENMLDGVISIDDKGIIQTFNRAAEVIFGYSRDELIGQNVSLLMDSPHREIHDSYIAKHLSGEGHHVTGRNRELIALHKNGSAFPMELGLVEVNHGEETTFVGIVRDITYRKQKDKEIHQLAFYDSLTLLPNRRLLVERLQQMVAKCTRHKQYGAVLFLDLDNFKSLNDSAGHNKGDLLLTQVATRLTQAVRKSDTVSRWGGDEFVVVIEELGTDKATAANQAEKAADKIVYELTKIYDLDGLSYMSTASIGITLFNTDSHSTEEMLKQADMAMYKAKTSGRNCIQFFDPEMQNAVTHQVTMEHDLHEAIKRQQFRLYYQRQVDQHGKTFGTEVLLRWIHPLKGIISPADFIPLTESSGLIIPIGHWVLRTACETLVQWSNTLEASTWSISVNISIVQFSHKEFVASVLDVLKETGANPKYLKLEITESLLAQDIEQVKAKMSELQQHGITFSIDDFGTGYSSLSYLQQLPIDQLKIDQSFVKNIRENSNNRAIAQAVITLADSMNLNVIAEGVETTDQQQLLQEMGCQAFQGYLFGKPCELEKLDLFT